MPRTMRLWGAGLATCVWLSACDVAPGHDGELESDEGALSGTATLADFTDCDEGERTRILQALAETRRAVASSAFRRWLEEQVLEGLVRTDVPNGVEWGTGYPEWIVHRMLEPINTKVTCVDFTTSAARNDREQIYVNHENARQMPIAELAGFIAHEVSHTKGFMHPAGYTPSSVPQLVQDLVTNLIIGQDPPAPLRRSLEPQETTLAPVGNDFSQAYPDQLCTGTGAVGGFFMWATSRAEPLSISLGAYCRARSGTGSDSATALAGDPFGVKLTSKCRSGEVAVGAYGHAGRHEVWSIGPLCADAVKVRQGRTVTPTARTEIGLKRDLKWRRTCPTGMAVKGMRAQASYALHRVELVCQRVASAEPITITPWRGPRLGFADDPFGLERCGGRGAMRGLKASHDPNGIYRLQGDCRRVVGSGNAAKLEPTPMLMPGHGGDGREPGRHGLVETSQECPTGKLMVGLGTHVVGNWVRGVQSLCADAKAWGDLVLSEESVISRLPRLGDLGGTWTESRCRRGEYLNGWWISEYKGVRGLEGVCRPFKFN